MFHNRGEKNDTRESAFLSKKLPTSFRRVEWNVVVRQRGVQMEAANLKKQAVPTKGGSPEMTPLKSGASVQKT